MIVRCTAKALKLLGNDVAVRRDLAPDIDDWYLNLLWVRRRRCLLLVHIGTLFPVFAWDVRVRDLRPVGPYVVSQVEAALRDEGLPPDWLGDLTGEPMLIANTADRQVLGFMTTWLARSCTGGRRHLVVRLIPDPPFQGRDRRQPTIRPSDDVLTR